MLCSSQPCLVRPPEVTPYHLNQGDCDSQSKPTEYGRSVGSFLSMASLSVLPHLINSRNSYVKNLVCRWRTSSPYTIGDLKSNLKITAGLDLVVIEKERITVQLKFFPNTWFLPPSLVSGCSSSPEVDGLSLVGLGHCSESGTSRPYCEEDHDVQGDGFSFLDLGSTWSSLHKLPNLFFSHLSLSALVCSSMYSEIYYM